jgi:type III pantothenate kinase
MAQVRIRIRNGLPREAGRGALSLDGSLLVMSKMFHERAPQATNQFPQRSRLGARVRRSKLPEVVRRAGAVFVALVAPWSMPNEKQNYLLVDVSNSFTKLAFASTRKLEAAERIETARLNATGLGRLIGERRIERIVVSSVVPKKNAAIRRAAGKVPVTFVSAKCELGVGVDYPEPHSIGADRLANVAAVVALYGCPAAVVDFGTAVTFDVVSAERCYIGGVIAPGLEAMTNYLYNRTALLPKLTLAEPRRAIGRSTRAAMMSGAVFGYRGLVKEILARISAEAFGERKARIVATGGYAPLIGARMSEIDTVHRDLTLEGLRIIGNLNH